MTSSVEADCLISSHPNFDRANGLVSISYSHEEFIKNPDCAYVNPKVFGYDKSNNGDDYKMAADMNAFFTSIAVRKDS